MGFGICDAGTVDRHLELRNSGRTWKGTGKDAKGIGDWRFWISRITTHWSWDFEFIGIWDLGFAMPAA